MAEFEAVRAAIELIQAESKVLFGALLGALLITVSRGHQIVAPDRRIPFGKQCTLVIMTLGVGYLFEPLVIALVPLLAREMAAFVGAVLVIPVCLKLLAWLDAVDLRELIQRWRR